MHRFAMIDGLRGIGALAIATYHIFRYGDLPAVAQSVVPEVLHTCILNGWMAVQWFFVIAGFAAVLSTRTWQFSARQSALHVVRRVVRLGAVYWVALALTAVLTILAIDGWDDRSLNESKPTVGQFVAHVLFLQDILGYESLNTGVWFIAIALQMDIAFIALLWISQFVASQLEHRCAVAGPISLVICFGPLAIWSLFWSIGDPKTDIWFHHFFCMFMLGGLLGWTVTDQLSSRWFWGYVALVVIHLLTSFTYELFIALIAALCIYSAWSIGKLQTWLNAPALQLLGTLSYSLFVIHYPVSWMVGKIGYQLTGDHAGAAAAWLVACLVASLAAAWLLHNFVERPVLEKTRTIGMPAWITVRYSHFWPRASAR